MSSSSDEFHDSHERIISSSCSSTSASDSDSAPRPRRPPASSDAWLAAPAPVAERRRLLLSRMGLTASPSLHRRSFSVDFANFSSDPQPQQPHGLPRPLPPASAAGGGGGDDRLRRLTIKNLDTGREFVVGEDTHDVVRDVGTGRQLTMEEFEMCAGRSPLVHELMRRQQTVEGSGGSESVQWTPRRRGGWLKSIKSTVAPGHQRRRSCSSAADDSWTKVRRYGKSQKELSCLYMSQEIQAHNGAIWCMKFSLDGRFLASAGEDCVIHVWGVTEKEGKGEGSGNCSPFVGRIGHGSPEMVALSCIEANHWEKKRRAKIAGGRRSASVDQVMVPENVFALSEKPMCSFRGHLNDVLDLSWSSKSEHLLSSSMDKTVRLWDTSCNSCLKIFSHSDYVTCIQFNPVDDRFFISGSLDEKVRIWNIPDRQIVDWDDLHEMVTAACYTPNGQGALVGSHKGSCHLYNTSDNRLHDKSQINMQNKKRKSSSKKITGFQFAQGSSSEVVITSADSRIRVVDGAKLVHKFKGFRNTSSQMTACLTANGRYVICASEDSHVYLWRYDAEYRPNRSNGIVTAAQSYENFYCQDVTVAVPWSGTTGMGGMLLGSGKFEQSRSDGVPEPNSLDLSHITRNSSNSSYFSDRISATWPEEKLMLSSKCGTHCNGLRSSSNGGMPLQCRSAWGMVIVTAGRGGKISAFQNFGMPATG